MMQKLYFYVVRDSYGIEFISAWSGTTVEFISSLSVLSVTAIEFISALFRTFIRFFLH